MALEPINPSLPRRVSRRVLLTAGGPALLAVCIGCSAATSGGGTTTAAPTSPDAPSSGSSSAEASTASSGKSSSSSASSTANSSTASSSTASSSTASSSTAESSSSEPSTSASSTSEPTTESSSSAAEPTPAGTVVAAVADIPADGGLIVSSPQGDLILALDGGAGGTVVAHTAVCTHQQRIIAGDGRCPAHGSLFDVVTGAVLNGPAQSPLAAVTVEVAGGQVYVA